MINCHLTDGGYKYFLILQTLSHMSAREENVCRSYLANRMLFRVVCTLIDNDTRHYNGQSLVHSRGAISHNIKDNERDLCQDLLTIEISDSDLKVHARHHANELAYLFTSDFPFKNFCKLAQHAEKYAKLFEKIVMMRTCCR